MKGDLIFYAFALLTVVSGLFVVFSRNIVHAGFSLLFTLFGVAGLYALLGADFLAVTQVVVYIGGILVLVIFTIMMTRIPKSHGARHGLDLYVPAGIFALVLFAVLYRVITGTDWPSRAPQVADATTAVIGVKLMTDYIFPFEYASLLLLVAMIGAAILIREVKEQPAPEAEAVPAPVAEASARTGVDAAVAAPGLTGAPSAGKDAS